MNKLVYFFIVLLPYHLNSQAIDPAVEIEVDSLIKKSKEFGVKRNLQVASKLLEDAGEKVKIHYGLNSDKFAEISHQLGNILAKGTDFEVAEKKFLDAIEIYKPKNDKLSEYYDVMQDYAFLCRLFGHFDKAEANYKLIKRSMEETNGPASVKYCSILRDYGVLKYERNLYKEAEKLLLESEECYAHNGIKDNYPVTEAFANLYSSMGILNKALEYRVKGRNFVESKHGKKSLSYAQNQVHFGNHFLQTGNLQNSEIYFLEAKSLFEDSLKVMVNPFYINCLGRLAYVYLLKKDLDASEKLYQQVFDIFERQLNNRIHPFYFECLINFANLLIQRGETQEADLRLRYLSQKTKDTFGEHSIYFYNCILSQCNLYHITSNVVSGDSVHRILTNRAWDFILNGTGHLSEAELMKYIIMITGAENRLYSYTNDVLGQSKEAESLSYDNALFHKGFVLNAFGSIQNAVFRDSVLAEQFKELKEYKLQLYREYTKEPEQRTKLSVLETLCDSKEKEIVSKVNGLSNLYRQVQWIDIREALESDELAMEIVYYKYHRNGFQAITNYAAILIGKGYPKPVFIPLFEEKTLNFILTQHDIMRSEYINHLYSYKQRGVQILDSLEMKSLYHLIWMPIEKYLSGVRKIYYSPAGLLHRINLGAIPMTYDLTISDRYDIITLNSTRQLVIAGSKSNRENEAVLFGGIHYDSDSSSASYEPALAYNSRNEISFDDVEEPKRTKSWPYLPGSEREIFTIEEVMKSNLFKVRVIRGLSATERAFKELGQHEKSPFVLHLATHGYFFPDRTNSTTSGVSQDSVTSEGIAKAVSSAPKGSLIGSEPVFKMSDHPMLRSGLIMAGGNEGWKGKKQEGGKEDGILTAYEISQMNLSNTELVVLSACETGLGDIKGNEGVYGLQRAFKIAGVKYLMMSLWQIPDRETKEFMVAFYKNWLNNRKSIPEAFRITQKEMRERFINPYAWAGFVLVE